MCNGRGRFGGQTAGGHPKAFPRPRQPLFAVPALRELKSACSVSILLDAVTVPPAFHGVLRGSPGGGQQQFANQTLRVHLLGLEVEAFCRGKRNRRSARRLPRECSRQVWQCSWRCTQKCARSVVTCFLSTYSLSCPETVPCPSLLFCFEKVKGEQKTKKSKDFFLIGPPPKSLENKGKKKTPPQKRKSSQEKTIRKPKKTRKGGTGSETVSKQSSLV